MRVLIYDEIDREEWSRLVASSATGTWFQTPEDGRITVNQCESIVCRKSSAECRAAKTR